MKERNTDWIIQTLSCSQETTLQILTVMGYTIPSTLVQTEIQAGPQQITLTESDGCQDSNEDLDDDNDGIVDAFDSCPVGSLGWTSTNSTDYDSDGCRDSAKIPTMTTTV